jgi:hypothetical protein
MPSLAEVQRRMTDLLLGRSTDLPEGWFRADRIAVGHRLDVYRNNIYISLKDVLIARYPAVRSVVGEHFFLYVTERFILDHPPREATLSAYGSGFAKFLASFAECAELPYLADLAQLEWQVHEAARAPSRKPIDSSTLASLPQERLLAARLRFSPSVSYFYSQWPIDRIFKANRTNDTSDSVIDLDYGAASLEVRRLQDEVIYRSLSRGAFAFRSSLNNQLGLQDAAQVAISADPEFDLLQEIPAMLNEGLVIGYELTSSTALEVN